MNDSMLNLRGLRSMLAAALLCLAPMAAHAHGDEASKGGWDVETGAFHVHLLPADAKFHIHVHDAKTHGSVNLAQAKVTARLLAGGKTTEIPLKVAASGVMEGAQTLKGDWTMLVSINVPGQKPAQARFSSKMKQSGQDAAHSH